MRKPSCLGNSPMLRALRYAETSDPEEDWAYRATWTLAISLCATATPAASRRLTGATAVSGGNYPRGGCTSWPRLDWRGRAAARSCLCAPYSGKDMIRHQAACLRNNSPSLSISLNRFR
ncbi:unnamed protein product [Prorocentrum cordatum]|uniref:Selenoprotein O n=1 Tax=Prorocentrum cordatum TaxID=2364126 RepID=A0ABN9V0Z1_9DINO|nr:unnamed protein product [Polarella glacialis]